MAGDEQLPVAKSLFCWRLTLHHLGALCIPFHHLILQLLMFTVLPQFSCNKLTPLPSGTPCCKMR